MKENSLVCHITPWNFLRFSWGLFENRRKDDVYDFSNNP